MLFSNQCTSIDPHDIPGVGNMPQAMYQVGCISCAVRLRPFTNLGVGVVNQLHAAPVMVRST